MNGTHKPRRQRSTVSVDEAIALAEQLLPGAPAADGESDPRWQAIIEIGEYISMEPERVWEFIVRWGSHEDSDLRAAISTCLLEELLAEHFDQIFPRVEERVRSDPDFADTFEMCWKMGQSDSPFNAERFDALKAHATRRAG